MPQNTDIALQLWNEAADLGHTESKFRLGAFYEEEDDDVDRAIVLYEEAAMEGHSESRVGQSSFIPPRLTISWFYLNSCRPLQAWMH